jgi:hypothetical protein
MKHPHRLAAISSSVVCAPRRRILSLCDGRKIGNNSICANIQNTKLGKEGKKRKGKKICRSYLSLALHASLVSYSEFWASCLRPKCQVPKVRTMTLLVRAKLSTARGGQASSPELTARRIQESHSRSSNNVKSLGSRSPTSIFFSKSRFSKGWDVAKYLVCQSSLF